MVDFLCVRWDNLMDIFEKKAGDAILDAVPFLVFSH